METVELRAQERLTTGKNKARQSRASGRVPVSLYGHKTEAISLDVDSREFDGIMRAHAGAHIIMKLKVDGRADASVIVREIQRHPVRDHILHVDLFSVALDETIVTGVQIRVVGDSAGIREGGVLQHGVRDVQIEALPTALPEFIEVDITELTVGQSLHAGDIKLAPGLRLASSPDEVVATVLALSKAVKGLEVEEGAAEAAGEAAEESTEEA